MAETTPKQIIEVLLMAARGPLSIENLSKIFTTNNQPIATETLRELINEIALDYANSGIELKEVANGWRFQIKSNFSQWINKLYEERPPKYSQALLEILALIVYRQPITRAEIEEIRGVTVSTNIIKTLLEHEWIKIVGHKEVPGKPALFATTKKFLDHFNLKHLDELPPLMEFTESISSESQLKIDAAKETQPDDSIILEDIHNDGLLNSEQLEQKEEE